MSAFNQLPIESEEAINFFTEDIELQLSNEAAIADWIKQSIQKEQHQLGTLNFILCSDSYLHKINVEYLNHDTLTDVITFPYREDIIEGDIFISVERIKENAKTFGVKFEQELHRIMIHGVLHLMGYGDKNPTDKKRMTDKENIYLSFLEKA